MPFEKENRQHGTRSGNGIKQKENAIDSTTNTTEGKGGDGAIRRIRHYEELEGGVGKEIFFRSPRYGRSDLGRVEPTVKAVLSGVTTQPELFDASQSGIAFVCLKGIELTQGILIDPLLVSFDGHEVYRGRARISSIRVENGQTIVGAALLDGLIDISDILHLQEISGSRDPETEAFSLSPRKWYCEGHERFKALVAEFHLFLQEAKEKLARLEERLPRHVLHSEAPSATRQAVIQKLKEEFVPLFVRYTEEIDAVVRGISPATNAKLKRFSLAFLHDFMMEAPLLHRTRHKPLGYAGDFEVMRYLYERRFEGDSLFAKALNLAAASTRGARAVCCRKDLLKRRLIDCVTARKDRRSPIRIASIAAGPAQEIHEFLQETYPSGVPISFVLFDQDPLALSFAQRRLLPLTATKWQGKVEVVYLHDSVTRLLFDPTIFQEFGPFDMIFSSGLFDYLRFEAASGLTRALYENLAEGGGLYIGNMVPENPSRWLLEHQLDWFLIYRSREEMTAFATAGAPEGTISIEEEETGINPFLRIERKG